MREPSYGRYEVAGLEVVVKCSGKCARAIVLLNFLPEEGRMSLEILPVVVQLKKSEDI